MNDLDLDALERRLNRDPLWWSVGAHSRHDASPTFKALIQRLREAEAERDWAIEQSKRASVQWNRDLQRIAQLERVRETAIKALREWDDDHSRTPDCNFPEEELRAAIAASNNE